MPEIFMPKSDNYTQNLVVRPKRKAAEVNPETEEAFEESKALVKESVHKAASVNVAFLTWLGIFCYRLCRHVWKASIRRLFGKPQAPRSSSPPRKTVRPSRSSSGQRPRTGDKPTQKTDIPH